MGKVFLATALTLMAFSVQAEVVRLDFGAGALREGWARVSADNSRWSGETVFEEHCDLPDYAALAQTEKSLPVYPNELDCDFAAGSGNTRFTVNVPDGEYVCWMLFGYANDRNNPKRPDYFDTKVAINGEVRDTVRLRFPATIVSRSFPCKAAGGKITFDFSTDGVQWMVAAIMLYRAEDAGVAGKEIAAIEREIDFLPPALAHRWTLRESMDKETPVDLITAESLR